jgi:hypothetical protein
MSGIQGSGSNMSTALYLKKMEQTCMFEDPDMLDSYYRSTLKNMHCDKPMFESDQPRRDNYSEDRLNLRHSGARVTTQPYLPDGTFLDFGGLEEDSRGTALDPNMMLHRKQQEARGKFIKFYSDEDASVPSEGRTQARVIADIKGQFYRVKNQLKIFDTSLDSRHNGGTKQILRTNAAECMQEKSDREYEMADAMCYNTQNITNNLSNNTSIGWRRTTDHIFQVAKYGITRKNKDTKSQNLLKNRQNATIAHDVLVSYQGQNVMKSVGLKMIDLAKKKQNSLQFGNDAEFGKGRTGMQRSQKLTPKDLSGMMSQSVDVSQDAAAHTELNGEQVSHVNGKMTQQRRDLNLKKKSLVDMYIVSYMANNNRKLNKKVLSDLREEIAQSADFITLLHEQNNKTNSVVEVKNELLWSSMANFERGTSMKVQNYKRGADKLGAKDQGDFAFEEYKKEQKTSDQRRGNIQNPDQYIFDVTDYDQDAGLEVVGTKLIGGMGSKYTRENIDNGDIDFNDGITVGNSR